MFLTIFVISMRMSMFFPRCDMMMFMHMGNNMGMDSSVMNMDNGMGMLMEMISYHSVIHNHNAANQHKDEPNKIGCRKLFSIYKKG